jgi:hypothetical protein
VAFAYVAPIDGDSGGAWIGTNEFGVSVCLLNGARRCVQVETADARSRGLLLIDLMTGSSVFEVKEHVSNADLTPYAPFTLAVLSRVNIHR